MASGSRDSWAGQLDWTKLSASPQRGRDQDQADRPSAESGLPSSRSRTSVSLNRRWPPGVRMLLMRPDAAHLVTVLGSTLKSAATSPGVSKRSLLPSIVFTPWSLRVSP
jgi:hypothetical protein